MIFVNVHILISALQHVWIIILPDKCLNERDLKKQIKTCLNFIVGRYFYFYNFERNFNNTY